MQVMLPDFETPARVILPAQARLTADQFFDLCEANPGLWMEMTSEGEIIIMPPAGSESSYRSGYVSRKLGNWAERENNGEVFDASGGFALPDGSVMAPDAAWVARDRLAGLTSEQKRRHLPLAPDFVVEVMSPSDRLADAQAKMRSWIRNGVALGWLIDADRRTVFVYRASAECVTLQDPASIAGEGPVAGFVLDLARVWEGLS